jgi:class 3 adenylate cyclase
MTELQNRTLICSVLFIDIVDYSQKAVAEQIALKDRLNTLLSEALRGVALNDRIILDTGDGAAISFIGDPEDALFVATALRDAIQAHPDKPLSTRMGINLGPVRLVKDINGRPNVIGDGINVAQRVMTFADPGQVLVSRSYYEVVSRLSEETSKLFSYEGSRRDKHIREHEVYAVGAVQPAHRRAEPEAAAPKESAASRPALLSAATGMLSTLRRSALGRPPLATALAVAAILMAALVVRASRESPDAAIAEAPVVAPPAVVERTKPAHVAEPAKPAQVARPAKAAPVQEAAKPAQVPDPAKTPQRVDSAKSASRVESERRADAAPAASKDRAAKDAQAKASDAAAPPASSKEGAQKDTKVASAERAPASTGKAAAGQVASAPSTEGAAQTKLAAPAAPATLALAVAPWGEVHVNGKLQGVSPPLQELQLPPGKHRIELRNTGAKPHVVNIDAKPGQRIRIKHKFK